MKVMKKCLKIDSLKILNNEIYAFTSGESTGSVNKWGMDYYALAKISSEGKVKEKLFGVGTVESGRNEVRSKWNFHPFGLSNSHTAF